MFRASTLSPLLTGNGSFTVASTNAAVPTPACRFSDWISIFLSGDAQFKQRNCEQLEVLKRQAENFRRHQLFETRLHKSGYKRIPDSNNDHNVTTEFDHKITTK